jgi:preprotein translocase subunit YajC
MHLILGVLLAAALFWFAAWRANRKRMRTIRRMHEMLYSNANRAELHQYVRDVYSRR